MSEEKIAMKCGNCRYRIEEQLPPPHIQKVNFCKALPPTPMLVPAGNGGAQQISMWPMVALDSFCFQFEAADPDEKKSEIVTG